MKPHACLLHDNVCLGANDIDGASGDLLACHRLARLVGQRPANLIQTLIAVAIDATAARGDAALIVHGLSAEQAEKFLAEFDQLPPLPKMADVMDQGERIQALDTLLRQLGPMGVDMNLMLKRANQTYDRMVEGLKSDNHVERHQALETLEAELRQQSISANKLVRAVPRMVINLYGDGRHTIGSSLLNLLMPALMQAESASTRSQVRRDQVRIGLALAEDHEKWEVP